MYVMMQVTKRLPHFTLAAVAFLAASSMGHAQSAYDYPWCAVYPRNIGATSCYYQTYQQCMETMSGIGGSCIRSPYYRGPAPRRGRMRD
ncbi:MAG TPA: DUF3551 domain-containing protein [Xanthobacteraceae bacterium]|nr:DUF3551 domain-containing protein [Xanthobacteraceae bacterium]